MNFCSVDTGVKVCLISHSPRMCFELFSTVSPGTDKGVAGDEVASGEERETVLALSTPSRCRCCWNSLKLRFFRPGAGCFRPPRGPLLPALTIPSPSASPSGSTSGVVGTMLSSPTPTSTSSSTSLCCALWEPEVRSFITFL